MEIVLGGSEETPVVPSEGSLTHRAWVAGTLWVDTATEPRDVHLAELHLSARLSLDQRFGSSTRLKVSGRFRYVVFFPAAPTEPEPYTLAEAELGEAFAGVYFDGVDLEVGNLVFAWGANEGLAPADVLNPFDLRFGLAGMLGGAQAKRAVPAVSLRTFHEVLGLELVVLPLFVPNRVALFGYDFSVAAAGGLLPAPVPDPRGLGFDQTGVDQVQPFLMHTRLPQPVPENWQFALRATVDLGDANVGLSAIDGFDPFPRQRIDPDLRRILVARLEGRSPPLDAALAAAEKLERGIALYEAWHARRRVVAADVEVPIASVTLRGDLGYSPGRTLYAVVRDASGARDLTWTVQPVLSGALGTEYFDVEGRTAGLVAYAFAALDVPGDRRLVGLEDTQAGFDAAEAGRTAALWGVMAYARAAFLDERLEVTVAGLWQEPGGGYLFAPSVTYAPADHHRLSLRAEVLGGGSSNLLGAFDHTDRIGIEWRASF